MDDNKFKKFKLPEKMLQDLYELTGGPNCYKGFVIAYCDENGTPVIYTNCESQITESGLLKSIEDYLQSSPQSQEDLEEGS
tara:strand:+ start:271 stop:513 length:243 start_codon:yes stop_codon:yes gene_type:complete